jgi:hypothetical protein
VADRLILVRHAMRAVDAGFPSHDRQPVIEAPTGITFVGYGEPTW